MTDSPDASQTLGSGAAADEELGIEDAIGEYRVLEVLGLGAMGLVYRAWDPRLEREVALKVVHPARLAKDAERARARLVLEARALARVTDPNVLSIYDVGEHEGAVFVALELVDGVDLAHWLRARPRPWREVLDVFAAVASGLRAVHAAGLVHRDIKPANILVELAAGSPRIGRVRVADFGIVRMADEAPATRPNEGEPARRSFHAEASLTEEGHVVGTPAYMAPEQHMGQEVGPAADQYALCVALFEALYGTRPFPDDPRELLRRKLDPPRAPPPSNVPRRVFSIVARGLSPGPSDRFASMEELLAALLRDRARRRRRWAAAILGAAGIVGAIAAVSAGDPVCDGGEDRIAQIWDERRRAEIGDAFVASGRPYAAETWARASPRLDRYARAWIEAHRAACEAAREGDAMMPALLDRAVACLEARRERLHRTTDVLAQGEPDAVDHAIAMIDGLEPVAPCTDPAALSAAVPPPTDERKAEVAEIRRVIAHAEALQAAGRYAEAAAAADAALVDARAIGYPPVEVEALAIAGECKARSADVDGARTLLEEAVWAGEAIGHHEATARALVERTFIAGEDERDIEAARRWGGLARATLRRIGEPAVLSLRLDNALGAASSNAGLHDEALRLYRAALERAGDDPDLQLRAASVHLNIGNVWRLRGELDEARASYERAAAIFTAGLGEDHPSTARARVRIGQLLDAGGRHAEAITMLRGSIASLQRTLDPSPELAGALLDLAIALRHAEADAESTETLERSVAMLERLGDELGLAHALVTFGEACLQAQVFDAAEAQLLRAVELLERIAPDSVEHGYAVIGLARVRVAQDRPDAASAAFLRAAEIGTAAPLGARLASIATLELAELHHRQGEGERAFEAMQRSDAIAATIAAPRVDDRLVAAIARVEIVAQARPEALSTAVESLHDALVRARESGLSSQRIREGELALDVARRASKGQVREDPRADHPR